MLTSSHTFIISQPVSFGCPMHTFKSPALHAHISLRNIAPLRCPTPASLDADSLPLAILIAFYFLLHPRKVPLLPGPPVCFHYARECVDALPRWRLLLVLRPLGAEWLSPCLHGTLTSSAWPMARRALRSRHSIFTHPPCPFSAHPSPSPNPSSQSLGSSTQSAKTASARSVAQPVIAPMSPVLNFWI